MQVRMGMKQKMGYRYSDAPKENGIFASSGNKKKQELKKHEYDKWRKYVAANHQTTGLFEEYDGRHLDTDEEYPSIETLANEIQNLRSTIGNSETQGQKIKYKELQVGTRVKIH